MENLSEVKRIYNQNMLLYTEIKNILLEHNYGLEDEQFEEQNSEEPNVSYLVEKDLYDEYRVLKIKEMLPVSLFSCTTFSNLYNQ